MRAATADDVPALAALVREYWAFEGLPAQDPAAASRLLRQVLADPRAGRCWVAEDGGALIGYLLACPVFSLEHGGWMDEIDEFHVVERRRGRGVGTALLERATAEARAAGRVRIQLQLGEQNTDARRFYEGRGFRRRDRFQLWDKPLPAPALDDAREGARGGDPARERDA